NRSSTPTDAASTAEKSVQNSRPSSEHGRRRKTRPRCTSQECDSTAGAPAAPDEPLATPTERARRKPENRPARPTTPVATTIREGQPTSPPAPHRRHRSTPAPSRLCRYGPNPADAVDAKTPLPQ